MGTTAPDQSETEAVPGDKAKTGHAPVPAGPRPPSTPGRTQLVDEEAQEQAAEEREKGGGHN